ncbi:FCD domain-containing protein [Nocardia fusca]|uniref:FCD domain-containing protein n=1 Tax=Nocardia fusca TaxID=941183 RepID=UPI0037CB2408
MVLRTPRFNPENPREETASAGTLDAVRLSAWRAVSSVRDAVYDELNEKMSTLAGLPVEWYEVLVHLREATGGSLRQTAIEEHVSVGSSGVSRMLARMERARLITRAPATEDMRALVVSLTARGADSLIRATPVYMSCVQSVFGNRLDDAEAATVARLLHKVLHSAAAADPSVEHAHLVPFGKTLLSITEGAVAVSDAIAIRNALEPLLAAEAAKNVTAESETEMRSIIGQMAGLLDRPEEFFRADWRLHRAIARLSTNVSLRAIYLSLLDNIETHLDFVVPTAHLDAYLESRLVVHARLVNAICSQDLDRVAEAVLEHDFDSAPPVQVADLSPDKAS